MWGIDGIVAGVDKNCLMMYNLKLKANMIGALEKLQKLSSSIRVGFRQK